MLCPFKLVSLVKIRVDNFVHISLAMFVHLDFI